MIIISSATSNRMEAAGIVRTGLKAAFDKRIRRSSWGIIIGKPSTAIIAAFCWAFAAIAAKKVKTRLSPHPPNSTNPINGPTFSIGLPRKSVNKNKLSKLIISISNELNNSLAKTKFIGLAME